MHTYTPTYLLCIPNMSLLGVWNWSETGLKPPYEASTVTREGEPIIQELTNEANDNNWFWNQDDFC